MMALLILLLTMSGPDTGTSLPDSTQALYAAKNAAALDSLLADAPSREAALLCRYRLYPLRQHERYLADLPADLNEGSARELALLAGLWGYKAGEASLYFAIRHGLRSEQLLEEAKTKDPDDPFVLLIEGQSLLFKPKIAGGDPQAALDRFRRLREVIQQRPNEGIAPMEVDLWIWYALDKLKADQAPAARERLLAQNPPPLFKEFLLDPP